MKGVVKLTPPSPSEKTTFKKPSLIRVKKVLETKNMLMIELLVSKVIEKTFSKLLVSKNFFFLLFSFSSQ